LEILFGAYPFVMILPKFVSYSRHVPLGSQNKVLVDQNMQKIASNTLVVCHTTSWPLRGHTNTNCLILLDPLPPTTPPHPCGHFGNFLKPKFQKKIKPHSFQLQCYFPWGNFASW
jgi:hypothetical protein